MVAGNKTQLKCLVTLSPQMLNIMLSTVRKYIKTLFRFLSFQNTLLYGLVLDGEQKKCKLLIVVMIGFSLIYWF